MYYCQFHFRAGVYEKHYLWTGLFLKRKPWEEINKTWAVYSILLLVFVVVSCD